MSSAVKLSQFDYIRLRSEALAKEFLTRREDVEVEKLDQMYMSYMGMILPDEKLPFWGFMPFGIVLLDGQLNLRSERAATRFARDFYREFYETHWRSPTFLMPLVALVFSMRDGSGYYAWAAEPKLANGKPRLVTRQELDFALIENTSLDDIVAEMKNWYAALAGIIAADR